MKKIVYIKDDEERIGQIIISLFASTQRLYVEEALSKLNNLSGLKTYDINFKILKQDEYHVLVAYGKDFVSQEELTRHLLYFFTEQLIKLWDTK